jgi:5-methylthioadenosine/S-adenosylhomocysteine deaminase
MCTEPPAPGTPDNSDCPDEQQRAGVSRRGFLGAGAATVGAGVLGGGLLAGPQVPAAEAATDAMPRGSGKAGRRFVLKGGIVLSLDPNVGDFAKADVLIDGKKIAAVKPNLSTSAPVVDASNTIIMPGFVDTHHHQYQSILRSLLSNSLLIDGPDNYFGVFYGPDFQSGLNAVYQPQDAYAGELIASLGQINSGVTTTVDFSQVSNTPDHDDAMIQALKDSGRRAVFAYAAGTGSGAKYPNDIFRIQTKYFSSTDQLLTLALGAGLSASEWGVARQAGVPIVTHVVGDLFGSAATLKALGDAGLMGPDCEYIHATRLPDDLWQKIADTGGKVSIACPIEMTMRHGMPAIQAALDHGIKPSLSVDVESVMTADMFTQMREVATLQRALINERALNGEQNLPPLLTCRDALKFATVEGAKCCNLDSKIGTLTPGKEADIIMLRTDAMNVAPINNVPGAIVSLMDTSNVDTVLIAGKIMKWRGALVGVDQNNVRKLATQARDRVLAAGNYHPPMF